MNKDLDEVRQAIQKFIKNHPQRDAIESLSAFGSIVKGTAKKNSDIDLLVNFNKPIGYFNFIRLQNDLANALHKEVDLVTQKSLSHYFRDEVLEEAVLLYEK